jgi:putative ABC transport system permease protein
MLSVVGGIIGMVGGFTLAAVVGHFLHITFVIPVWAVISSLLVTSFVGIISGLYPAQKAAKLDPILALRYE